MKALIAILVVLIVGVGGWKVWEYWDKVSREKEAAQAAPAPVNEGGLPGLPRELEKSLEDARKKGPEALKEWIERVRKSPKVTDPRLAYIQLDYLIMVSQTDPLEAKKVYFDVKKRLDPSSPVYPRLKALEKTYEQ